jgi:hypothetical protein
MSRTNRPTLRLARSTERSEYAACALTSCMPRVAAPIRHVHMGSLGKADVWTLRRR